MADPVELQPAFQWFCPSHSCGQRNYVSYVTVDMPEGHQAAHAREILGLAPWEELPPGDLLAIPEIVTCSSCGAEYEAIVEEEGRDE